ncbi:hypothetical protein BDF22DRAFT_211534 [Syncephalis plumigaleata]|nr:hypothetical protein BDF22DRAFT_211534 [Syncephalis plumigaleata]
MCVCVRRLLNIALLLVAALCSIAALFLYTRQNEFRRLSLPLIADYKLASDASNNISAVYNNEEAEKEEKKSKRHHRSRLGTNGLSLNTICLALTGNLIVMGIRRYQTASDASLLEYSVLFSILDILLLLPVVIQRSSSSFSN